MCANSFVNPAISSLPKSFLEALTVSLPRTILFIAALAAGSGIFEGMAFASPKNTTAVAVLEAAIKSLKDKPNQFNLQVTCQGMQVTASGGSTGMNMTVIGGAPGSQTMGMKVTMDNAQCNVAGSKVDAAMKEQGEKAIELLTKIKSAIEANKSDKTEVSGLLSELGSTFIVPALQSVIEAVVKKALHLP